MQATEEQKKISACLQDYREHLKAAKIYIQAKGDWHDDGQLAFDNNERDLAAACDSVRVLGLAFEIAHKP